MAVQFASTRNNEQRVSLAEAIARGLAPDGGLYAPQAFVRPKGAPSSLTLSDVAVWLLAEFFRDDALDGRLVDIAREALNVPAPVVQLSITPNATWVLELFHGPTAAFKDFGARFLATSLAHLHGTVRRQRIVLVATSGDTGSAVAAAFQNSAATKTVLLFPERGVSPRQRHLLTCWNDRVLSLAVRGSFDSCQALVKAAFRDTSLVASFDLTSANSINLGRLLPQVVYFAAASLEIERRTGRPASFIIPSGNLGNAIACIWARRLGLPIGKIFLAHNANATVPDFFRTGEWRPRPSIRTLANAMDVGDPSNFERLKPPSLGDEKSGFGCIHAYSVSDSQIRSRIRSDFRTYGRIWCPHTATAAETFAEFCSSDQHNEPWVIVATAHPAKFDAVVEPLVQQRIDVPSQLSSALEKESRFVTIDATLDALKGIFEQIA